MGGGMVLFGGAAIPFHRLPVVLGDALAIVIHQGEVVLGGGVILFGGAAIPFYRLGVIQRDTFAVIIHQGETILGADVILLGGQAVPTHRFDIVLGDALAEVVHGAQAVLGVGVALFGGAAIPAHRLGVVRGDAFADVIHQAEIILRIDVALLGQRQPYVQGGFVLAARIEDPAVIEGGRPAAHPGFAGRRRGRGGHGGRGLGRGEPLEPPSGDAGKQAFGKFGEKILEVGGIIAVLDGFPEDFFHFLAVRCGGREFTGLAARPQGGRGRQVVDAGPREGGIDALGVIGEIRLIVGGDRAVLDRLPDQRFGGYGGGQGGEFGARRGEVEIPAHQGRLLPGRLLLVGGLQHRLANPLEHQLRRQAGHLHGLRQSQHIGAVVSQTIDRDFPRSGGIGDQAARRRVHPRQAPRRRAGARRERIVAAGVEDHEVHSVFGELHLFENEARADRLDGDFPLLFDVRPERNEVVLAADLNAVTGVEKQTHRVLAGGDQPVLQLEGGELDGLAVGVDALDDVETEAAQGLRYELGVVGGIGQWRRDFIGAVADHQGDAGGLLGVDAPGARRQEHADQEHAGCKPRQTPEVSHRRTPPAINDVKTIAEHGSGQQPADLPYGLGGLGGVSGDPAFAGAGESEHDAGS